MNQFTKWLVLSLVCVVALGSTAHARRGGGYNSGMARKYMQMQQQAMQMQQKAMMEALARQAAIEQHKREMHAKASTARHDKEEQDRQAAIAKRKATQDQPPRSNPSSPEKK